MLFSSPTFLLFFAAYFCCHVLVPPRYRNYLIIVGSTIFYAWWKIEYTWVPYLLMAIAYVGGYLIGRARDRWRPVFTAATVVSLFTPLAIFKYTDFVYGDVLGPLFGWNGKILDAALPLGISFVTFTLAAYVIDISRRKFESTERGSTVLAYVLFFPHLIAGPILRPRELIPQLSKPRPANLRRLAFPLAIFTSGLVKKLVFADQIAEIVDPVFNSTNGAPSANAALAAIYGFSVQIYCDFSGYTDMAIGLALLLGVRLPMNFLRPYCAATLVDFWRRWHITLSFWLRDYLYFPLGGSRRGKVIEIRNILITMILGGLWHGASWTFVIWGAVHGLGVSAVHLKNRLFPQGPRLPRLLALIFTFHFVTFAWILFRAPTLSKAVEVFAAPFIAPWSDVESFAARNLFYLFLIALFFFAHRYDDHRYIRLLARRARGEIFWPVLGLLWIIAIVVSQGSSAKFIYFDF